MRVNREIDKRVPRVEDPRGEVVPSPIRLRDRWYFDYTPRWPHLCVRKIPKDLIPRR